MILGYALFILAPTLALVTFFFAREALRNHRRRRAAGLILGAIATEALGIGLGIYQATYITPASLEGPAVPGSYVLLGREARDEIVLLANGTFVRNASYRGVTQRQHGSWTHTRYPGSYDSVHFDHLDPSCLRSTEPPGTHLHFRKPNEVLCMPSSAGPMAGVGAGLCRARGQLALCLGDEVEFLRE